MSGVKSIRPLPQVFLYSLAMTTNTGDASFADWLQDLLHRRGISQTQLAAYIGVDPSTVSVWLRGGKTPRPDSCAKLAAYARIPEETVLRLAGHLGEEKGEQTPTPRPLREQILELAASMPLQVPVYDELRPHAGEGGTVTEVLYLAPSRRRLAESVMAFRVSGDCMAPRIEAGDVIVIDKEMAAEDGDAVVVELEDGWSIRRAWFRNGLIVFECDNEEAGIPAREISRDSSPIYPVIDVHKGRPRLRAPRR